MKPKKSCQRTNIFKWLRDNIYSEVELVAGVALTALGTMENYDLKEKCFSYVTIGNGIG